MEREDYSFEENEDEDELFESLCRFIYNENEGAATDRATPQEGPAEGTTSSVSSTEDIKFKRKKEDNKMSADEWSLAIDTSLEIITKASGTPMLETSRDITENDFVLEPKQNRYTLRREALRYCLIFPWFHNQTSRFRQSLGKELRQGTTIRNVLEAMNYFFHLSFTTNEIESLRQLYSEMTIPISSHCLTTIVEVYYLFREPRFRLQQQSEYTLEGLYTPPPFPSSPYLPFSYFSPISETEEIRNRSPQGLPQQQTLSQTTESEPPTQTSGEKRVLPSTPSSPCPSSPQEIEKEALVTKRSRTNEWAIQKNCELIEFYEGMGPIDAHLFKELIENLKRANEALRAEGKRLETYSQRSGG